jgi:molybdopterin synthase catalytic subunit
LPIFSIEQPAVATPLKAADTKSNPSVVVQAADFDAGAVIGAVRAGNPRVGAVASFVGLMRDFNDGQTVEGMLLEHYAGMTEQSIEAIVEEAKQRWDLIEVRVVHRIGELEPGDQIVLVVVASGHRGEAFAACEFIMDYLKTRAPFWKKESTGEGSRWVESRISDHDAAERWKP